MNDNKERLYNALSQDYDMGTFEQFKTDIADDAKRRKLYDAIINEYDLSDYDSFTAQLMGDTSRSTPAPAADKSQYTFTEEELKQDNPKPISMAGVDASKYINPYGDTRKPLIAAPDVDVEIPRVPGEDFADRYVQGVMKRADAAMKPKSGWERAQESANVKIDDRYNDEMVKNIALGDIGELEARRTELSRINNGGRNRNTAVFIPTSMGGVATKQGYFDRDNAALRAADKMLQSSKQMIFDAQNSDGWTGGFFTKAGQTLIDPSTWDMGLSDANLAGQLLEVVEKEDKGEALTDAEQLLLDTAVNNLVLSGYYQGLTTGQKMAATTVESLPFMLEMAVSPLSGAGKAAARGAARYAIKKFGRKMARKAADGALKKMLKGVAPTVARVTGDIAGAYGMTLTTGAVGAAADAMDRMTGDITVNYDEEGRGRYSGRKNAKEFGEAVMDAINAGAIERYSEMLGNYFAPVLGTVGNAGLKGLEKVGLGSVSRWIGDIGKKWHSPQMKEFLDRTQWQGFLGEYSEEIAGGLINAAIVGDQTVGEVFGKDNLIDTALGLAVMSTVIPAVSSVNYAKTKRTEKRALDAAESRGRELIGEDWNNYADAVRTARKGAELTKNLQAVLARKGQKYIPVEQQKAVLDYAMAYNRYKALNAASTAAVLEGVEDAEILELRRDFDAGVNAAPADNAQIRRDYEDAMYETSSMLGADVRSMIPDYRTGLELAEQYEEVDASTAEAIRRYLAALARHDGMADGLRNERKAEVDALDAELKGIANENDGMIYPVSTVDGDGYITGGNVVVGKDGFIDESASDESVYVSVEGRTVPMAIGNLLGLGSVQDGNTYRAARIEEIDRRYEDRYNAMTMPAALDAPAVQENSAADENVPNADEIAARALAVDVEELSQVIPTAEKGLEAARNMESAGDVAAATAIREYVAERFGGNNSEGNIPAADVAAPDAESVQADVLSPAQQRKAKLAGIAQRIPKKGNKKLWTQAKAEDVAEYIATLSSDAAVQQATADKYIADIREKQGKMDAIEALELEDDVAFWDNVKAMLAQSAPAVAPVAENEMQPVAAEDAAAQGEEPALSVKESTPGVESSTSVPESQIENENGNENQSGDSNELVAHLTNEASKEEANIPQTEEVDEYGNHFVLASDGTSTFGVIDAESGLKQAPIKLSIGDNTVDENGNNHGYGLLHIEAERGDAIRNAGYNSVQDFVESVAKNYTDIREGGIIANNQTYLLELVDEHNNTLFIQLSKNGEYWTINSAGIFRKKYSRNKRKVYDRPALSSDTNTDTSGVDSGHIDGVTTPAGNSPQTFSTAEDTAPASNVQENSVKSGENAQNGGEKDLIEEMREQNRVAEEREQRAGIPPRQSDYSKALTDGDAAAQKAWEEKFDDYLGKLTSDDVPAIEVTISGMQERKSGIKAGNPDGYKENPNYKTYDYIEKALKRRKRELEKSSINEEKSQENEDNSTNNGEQQGEQVSEQDNVPVVGDSGSTRRLNGAVDMDTMLPAMSDAEFATLLQNGDIDSIGAYLNEINDALRIGDNAPLDGMDAVRADYRKAVEQYGGEENIPAEVMNALDERMEPYVVLERALFDRKSALQDRLRELRQIQEQAEKDRETAARAEHKATAYNGFLANKTGPGAANAEKALSKRYRFGDEGALTVAEFVEKHAQDGTLQPSTSEIPKYKEKSRRAWNRMDASQQAAEEERIKNGGTKTVYYVNGYELGKTAYDYARFMQERFGSSNEAGIEQTKPQAAQTAADIEINNETRADKATEEAVLSESEYADARSAEIMADNPNLDDVEAYNMALDEYPKYIGDMIESGKLSQIYKNATVGERIALNKMIQAAGYEISDVNTREVKEDAKNNESKFKVGDVVSARFADGSIVVGPIEKIKDGKINIRSNGRLYPVDESKIGKGIELQRGPLALDSSTPAFKRATEKTMQALENTGIEVVMATEEQVQEVLGIAEMQKRKSPETALPEDESSFKGTVISSDDGAKVLKDIDNAIAEYENKGNSAKTFIGDVARILRAVRRGSKSEYADIVTANGILVRIRLADHNVKVSNYDNAGINNGISIVISRKPNESITNDGDAHLVEFFYSDKKISKADGKPLVEILKSIKQALYSGEYKDNTGLAVREEVNIPEFSRVYHGSGAKFDRFDHSFMGTGEGAQAYGWGTYVTEVEGIGRTYATTMRDKLISEKHKENAIINKLAKQTLESNNGNKEEALDHLRGLLNESWSDKKRVKAQIKIIETGKFLPESKVKANLYTVEIPDDNGSNYLHWEKPVSDNVKGMLYAQIRKEGVGKFDFADQKFWVGKGAVFGNGELLYDRLTYALGSNKAASEFLSRAGFVGISYPANATTGGRADGARNYVIFNENDAQITDRVEFLRTSEGTVYGWSVGGRIYLTPEGVNPNTPVHEYTHLWASAIEQRNPELWAEVVEAMKQSPVWNEVMADEAYRDIWNDDNRMASEVLARLSGNENYRRTMQEAVERENDPATKFSLIAAWGRVKRALAKFWNSVMEMLDLPVKGEPGSDTPAWERFVNSAIGDFYDGVNPNVENSPMERMIGENTVNYTTEEQQIIDRAKADGTYMKAPNGKDTNLSPKQWAQVRTKSFREWFGDWMLAATETPVFRSKGTFVNLAAAEKWAKENLQGQSRVNKYTGEEISVSRKSVSEMLNEKTLKKSDSVNNHLAALQSVLDFIETGIPAEVHADTHGRDFDVMRLYNAIEIDGKVYRVKSTVRKVKQGDKFYTYEVQEMELIEERGADPNREGETPHNGNTSNNSITGAKLLNGVKKTNSNEEILQYSKVVDENGEPKILEHSTWNDDFYTFDIGRLGSSSGDEGVYGAGFYFGNVGHTQLYGDRAIQVYLDMKKPMFLPDSDVMKFFDFLVDNFDKEGLRDIVVKGNGKATTMGMVVDAIKEIQANYDNGVYAELIESIRGIWSTPEDRVIEQKIFRKLGFAFYRSIPAFIEGNIGRREFSEMLHKAGYDGVVFDNREWVAFSPNQIKSGTDNVGTFSNEDDDIRYRDWYGGNSGYVGYSMSKRAAEAREEGRYPKTDFKKEYKMPQQTLDALVEAGVIDNSEWHHTSKYGNRTRFYGWVLDEYADIYAENKKGIDALAKEVNNNIAELEKEERAFLDSRKSYQYPETFDWSAYSRRGRQLAELPDDERMAILRSEFPETAEAEKHNNRNREFSGKILEKKREQRKRIEELFEKKEAEAAERVDAEITAAVNDLAAKLNTDVEIVHDVSTLPDARKRGSKGWYERGKVYVVLENADSVQDAVETVLHEVVGHKGLRALFGDRFNEMLDDVFRGASKDVRSAIIERTLPLMGRGRSNAIRVATEEYMAEQAERGFDDYSLWEKVKGWFRNLLRSLGLDVEIGGNEIRYMLWRSYRRMIKGETFAEELNNRIMEADMLTGDFRQRQVKAASPTGSSGKELSAEVEIGAVRAQYEQRLRSSGYQFAEAMQDSMKSADVYLDLVRKTYGEDSVPDGMNFYMLENALSSANKAQADAFERLHFRKVIQAVAALEKEGMSFDEVSGYLMAIHGIERNREMAVKKALTDKNGLDKKAYEDWVGRKREIWDKGLTWEEEQRELDALALTYGAKLGEDFSGLSAMFGDDFTKSAYEAVRVARGDRNFDALHKAIKECTDFALDKQVECGMMSEETREYIRGMFRYYVPLRGFDATTAEEVYAYLTTDISPVAKNYKMKGRESKADNPLAWIANMAESAIVQGNRNRMKNAFFNVAVIRPTDLVSVSDKVYIEKHGDKWVLSKPTIPKNATPEDVNNIMKNFYDDMEKKVKASPEFFKKVNHSPDVPYVMENKSSMNEHQVYVRRNGKLYVLTVNGNPRLAQAINGLTNPDADVTGVVDKMFEWGEKANRQLSALYTTMNPDFVISNFARDMIYTNTMVWLKESKQYARRFNANVLRYNPKVMYSLLIKYLNGTLDKSNEAEKMFYDFMMNGGETGYTDLKSTSEHKKKIAKELTKGKVHKGADAVANALDIINRAVELSARFSAFVTSRQEGRTITRAIYDAKEISVNFNKKGSGAKFMGSEGMTGIGNAAAFVSGVGRSFWVFWNAGVQGVSNFGKAAKKNPVGAGTAALFLFGLGFVVPWLFGDDDDNGDNDYMNLPDYVRRTHLTIRFFWDSFVSVPLPIEYRALYGMGEYLANCLMGREAFSIMTAAELITQVLPINFLEEGGFTALAPSWAKPVVEVLVNKSWMGLPIAKQYEFNKLDPEYKRVYKNVGASTVEFSRMLNELGGGNANRRAESELFEWNPADMEYLLSGYGGGLASFGGKVIRTGETILGDREFEVRNVPLLNRLIRQGSPLAKEKAVKNLYYENLKDGEKWDKEFRGWYRDMNDNSLTAEEREEARVRYEEMKNSEDIELGRRYKEVKKRVKAMQDRYKDTLDETYKQQEIEIMREFNNFMREYK